ncbi:hypothetical protein [Actinomadura oligospora]|uniref:hypothetical protein n=1 Tax=Actinomadura oligospora TaxID=111804 RepID=UPI00047A279A|nr:hypothetical protein [Actinomadura oligospora]
MGRSGYLFDDMPPTLTYCGLEPELLGDDEPTTWRRTCASGAIEVVTFDGNEMTAGDIEGYRWGMDE